MTFKLFSMINKAFEEYNEVHLMDDEGAGLIATYDENTDIDDIDLGMKMFPHASLYVFNGDSYEKL